MIKKLIFKRHKSQALSRRFRSPRGFALIISISMMVLLVLLAVGLLSLGTISLRASGNSSAASVARSNARLAMVLAIGELQKQLGPDTRISAPGGQRDESANHPNLAGVWESWRIDPNNPPSASDYEKAGKDEKFLGWLASHSDPQSLRDNPDFAASGSFPGDEKVVLVPAISGGSDAVEAGKVRIKGDRLEGGFGWVALDEGVKARMNTGYDRSGADTVGEQTMALGSGQRAAVERMEGLGQLDDGDFDLSDPEKSLLSKTASLGSAKLFLSETQVGDEDTVDDLSHDLSMESAGVMADVARGGLKGDLSALFANASLPTEFDGQGIYKTLLDLDSPSQPRWGQLHEFARLHNSSNSSGKLGIKNYQGAPLVRAQAPRGWSAGSVDDGEASINEIPPDGAVLMPTVAKVQMVFTLLARDIYTYPKNGAPPGDKAREESAQLHGPWGRRFAGSSYDYLLHMLYTPIVTLHNPYSVTLEFSTLKVDFVNTPMAVQIFRNGEAQSTGLVPVTRMYLPSEKGGESKRFSMTLKDKRGSSGTPGSSTVRLLPGEVKVFSPYIPPTLTWAGEVRTQAYFFDWRNENEDEGRNGSHVDTSDIVGVSGWTGEGIGYDLDWFAPTGFRKSSVERENGRTMDRAACIGLKPDDQIHVEFAPRSDPAASNNRFQVEMEVNGVRGAATILEFDYETENGLQDTLLGKNGTLRYPKDGAVRALDLLDHSSVRLRDYERPQPFALFSAYGKTTSAQVDASPDDGRNAAKPWAFHHAVGAASSQKLTSEHPAHHSHEINLEMLDGTTADSVQISAQDRGNFVTGHTSFNGRKFGVLYDVPLAPMQTLPSLNAANLAAFGGLPRFAQPIGNSWAHPLLPTSGITSSALGEQRLDHSFLLNLGFYDRFYYSGFSDRSGPFLDGRSAENAAANFFEDGQLLDDPRFLPWFGGVEPATVVEKVVDATDGYRAAAAHQLLNGAFNVNSTSVEAWKAMLASMRAVGGQQHRFDPTSKLATMTELADPAEDSIRFSRFRLPGSESVKDSPDPEHAYWLGPKDIDEKELEVLAEAIVDEVRKRGPFLSMGEFVNRQLGSASDETLRGALQSAIDKAGLNNDDQDLGGYDITMEKVQGYEYLTPEAAMGSSAQGAPGYLTQADLLTALGNAATVRSDTFRIRTYGEATDASGRVIAIARCEAVVQRIPDFVDSANEASDPISDVSEANQRFGRRFVIRSFRWLPSGEV